MAQQQGGMFVTAFETKFLDLSWYATQLVSTKERIRNFIRDLNFEMQVLSVHMTSIEKFFNEVTDYVKKVEGVRPDGEAKVLYKNANNSGKF